MDYITPVNEYAVIYPDGEVVGYEDSEKAQAYINNYYRERIQELEDNPEYINLESNEERSWVEILKILGVDEGDCRMYTIDKLIEGIREANILDEEKEDIISRLIDEEIDLNINDFGIDDIIADIEIYAH